MLHRRGEDVRLFESRNRLGGSIHTEHVDGFTIDHGADMFSTQPPAVLELASELGFSEDLIGPSDDPNGPKPGAMIWSRGKMRPVPKGFVLMRATSIWPVLKSPLLSWRGKLRFALERFLPAGVADESNEESVAAFTRRRMGNAALETLVAPLVGGIYTADLERLSMSVAMGPIAALERQHGSLHRAAKMNRRSGRDREEAASAGARYARFRSFADGMGGLVRRISDTIPSERIHLNASINRLEPSSNLTTSTPRWTLADDATSWEFDRVVLACPPAAAAKLCGGLDPGLAAAFEEIESASAAIVCLGVHRDQIARPIDAFGFVVPPRQGSPLIAASMASHKFPGRAPEDHVLIRCFVGGVLQPHWVDQDDETIVTAVLAELQRMIGLTGTPRVQQVVRWRRAMPQYNLGHQNRIDAIESRVANQPHLHWTSNARGGVGIAPAVASARMLVQKLALELANPPSVAK